VHLYYHGAGAETKYAGAIHIGFFAGAADAHVVHCRCHEPILELKPGNTTTLAELRRIIKNNGFVSKEVSAVARGSVIDPQTFVVSGTNERLALSSAPQADGGNWRIVVAPLVERLG
jgi:hypothetical protein